MAQAMEQVAQEALDNPNIEIFPGETEGLSPQQNIWVRRENLRIRREICETIEAAIENQRNQRVAYAQNNETEVDQRGDDAGSVETEVVEIIHANTAESPDEDIVETPTIELPTPAIEEQGAHMARNLIWAAILAGGAGAAYGMGCNIL